MTTVRYIDSNILSGSDGNCFACKKRITGHDEDFELLLATDCQNCGTNYTCSLECLMKLLEHIKSCDSAPNGVQNARDAWGRGCAAVKKKLEGSDCFVQGETRLITYDEIEDSSGNGIMCFMSDEGARALFSRFPMKTEYQIYKSMVDEPAYWKRVLLLARNQAGSSISHYIEVVARDHRCAGCGKECAEQFKPCAGCRDQYYCGKTCADSHWKVHKLTCSSDFRCSGCHKTGTERVSKCPCNEVGYCSKKCQKAKWKRHKLTCKVHIANKEN